MSQTERRTTGTLAAAAVAIAMAAPATANPGPVEECNWVDSFYGWKWKDSKMAGVPVIFTANAGLEPEDGIDAPVLESTFEVPHPFCKLVKGLPGEWCCPLLGVGVDPECPWYVRTENWEVHGLDWILAEADMLPLSGANNEDCFIRRVP